MKRSRQNKPPETNALILEEIAGLTTKNGNGLASSISSSKFAYIAGCAVVLHDVHSGTRSHLIAPNRVSKPLSCVALSGDASIVAAGESGHHPRVLVWDSTALTFICELKSHQYGVSCMVLSPDGKHLVSVGLPRDECICFWDWRNKVLAAKVKMPSVSCPIASIGISLDYKFIVTAEKNQLKFRKVRWSLGSQTSTRTTSVTMHRRVDLRHHKDSPFVAVASLNWMGGSSANHFQAGKEIPFYAVTEKGTLCMVYASSTVINSVELEVTKCFALSTSTRLVACACNNGVVKLFGTKSLKYAGQLLFAEANRCNESTAVDYKTDVKKFEFQSESTFPDAVACQFSTPQKLVVVYNNHSLHIWDIHNIDQATRCCVLVSHVGCIQDVNNIPCENMHNPSLSCVAKGCSGGLSFATCSVDGDIRLWDLALQSESSGNGFSHPGNDSSSGEKCLVSAGIFKCDSGAKGISSTGFRSMAISSEGKHLAAGDFLGNIHIFDMCTSDCTCIKEGHGSEILSLSFNMPYKNSVTSYSENHLLLASGGCDGRIHIFNAGRYFNLFGSINYHSSAVTSVKVSPSGHQILSCSDRTLVLHGVDMSSKEGRFPCLHMITTSGTIHHMDVDHMMDVVLTVGQDKKISVFNIQSGKLIKWFNDDGDAGDPLKVTTDGSCSYLACSYSNRCIIVYDYTSGNIVARAITGHSKDITGILFLPDCKHLVSVGSDGCIFVWRLPALISSRMLEKTKENFPHFLPQSVSQPISCNQMKSYLIADLQRKECSKETSVNEHLNSINEEKFLQEGSIPGKAGFKFSISRLPKWARCKVINDSVPTDTVCSLSKVGLGHNYERLESEGSCKHVLESGKQFSATLSEHLALTESSQVSPSSLETHSWSTDNRWQTIHTVCMDMLDSPTTSDLKGLNMQLVQVSTTNSRSQDQVMETIHCNKRVKLTPLDSCINNPPAEPNSVQHYQSWIRNANLSQGAHEDVNVLRKDSQRNENFETNFCNLSTQLKTDENKSLTKTSHLSLFHEQREILRARKRSLSLHAEDSVGVSPRKLNMSNSSFLSTKPSKLLLEERSLREDSGNLDSDKLGPVELVRLSEEAFNNLEAAAEKALQSFRKLATVNTGEDRSSDAEVQLFDKTATRLPSVDRKIQEITQLLKSSQNFAVRKRR